MTRRLLLSILTLSTFTYPQILYAGVIESNTQWNSKDDFTIGSSPSFPFTLTKSIIWTYHYGPQQRLWIWGGTFTLDQSVILTPITWKVNKHNQTTDFNIAPIFLTSSTQNGVGSIVMSPKPVNYVPTQNEITITFNPNTFLAPSFPSINNTNVPHSTIDVTSTPGQATYSPFFMFLRGHDTNKSDISILKFVKAVTDKTTKVTTDPKKEYTWRTSVKLVAITTTDGKTIYIQRVKLSAADNQKIKKYAYFPEKFKDINYTYGYRFYIPCDPDHPDKECNSPTGGGLPPPTTILPVPGKVGEVLFLNGQNRGLWMHYQSYYDRELNNPRQAQAHTIRLVYEHTPDMQLTNLQWAWFAHTDRHQRHYWLTAQAGHVGIPHHDLFRYNLMGAVQQQLEHAKKLNYDFKIGLTGFDLPTMRILPTATLELWRTFHTQHQWIFEPQVQVSTMANFNRHAKFHDVTLRMGLRAYYKQFNGIVNYRISRFQAGAFHNRSQSLEGILNYNRVFNKNKVFNARVGYQQDLHAHHGAWTVGVGWRIYI